MVADTGAYASSEAHVAVAEAVSEGRLPFVSAQDCVDCGRPAQAYHHHRGYAPEHWLDVVALCDGCHMRRHPRRPRRRGSSERMALTMRFRRETFERGKALAEKQNRGFNGMVEALLQQAIAEDERLAAREVRRRAQRGRSGDAR